MGSKHQRHLVGCFLTEDSTREDMKTKPNNFARASALQITFSIALIFVSAILLVIAAVATPTLGNYPDTSIPLSTDTTVTPDAPPTNTTSINVSTSTDFKGKLEGDPMTGVVRVTDAHPAGTYTVTVTAFDSGGATTTKTFTLTVTTPATCNPVSFAAAETSALAWSHSVAVGDFNGDGKQDLAVANSFLKQRVDLVGRWRGQFQRRHKLQRWRCSYLSSGGRFQRRWQARPRHCQLSCQTTCRSCWAMARAVSAPPQTSALAMVLSQ